MTSDVKAILFLSCIAILSMLFQPVLGHAQSNLSEMEQAQTMEQGIFFGGGATQYDQCVARGFITPGNQKAEDVVRSFIKRSEQSAQNEKAKESFVYFQKGWDLVKQKIVELGPKHWEDNCAEINRIWNNYEKILNSKQ